MPMHKLCFSAAAVCGALCTAALLSALPCTAFEESPIPYADYYASCQSCPRPDASILISGTHFQSAEAPHYRTGSYTAAGSSASRSQALIVDSDTGTFTYEIEVPKTGLYAVEMSYCPIISDTSKIVFSLAVDGAVPYAAAQRLTLNKIYRNPQQIQSDAAGNQLCPVQQQAEAWMCTQLSDPDGLWEEPLLFALEQGRHTVTLSAQQAWFALEYLRFYNEAPAQEAPNSAPSAAALQETPPARLRIEGEEAAYLSDAALHPTYDNTSASVSPADPWHLVYNTIGGSGWDQAHQFISWEITVPADGWYKIGIQARQDALRGFCSYRRLLVDEQVPDPALEQIAFPYGAEFQRTVPCDADGNPVYVYLTSGITHLLTLEAVPGSIGEDLRNLEAVTADLSRCYQEIVMITGPEPDRYTDYAVAEKLPELVPELAACAERLRQVQSGIEQHAGAEGGTEAAALDSLALLLESCTADPLRIPEQLPQMKEYNTAAAAWLCEAKKQPLELDYLELTDAGTDFSAEQAGFWAQLWYSVRRFFASFREDADVLTDQTTPEDALEVWVALGRDQAQIVQTLTAADYVPSSGNPVAVRLVSGGIVEAALAGEEPDVALYLGGELPVSLACRDMLQELSGLDGYEAAAEAYPAEALVPYQYNGGTYGMPLTRSWAMLFYRADVLHALGIEQPPETWEELLRMLPVLQRQQLSVGLVLPQISSGSGMSQVSAVPESGHTFATLLLQNGSTYYTADQTRTRFDAPEAVDAFQRWTELYTKYGMEQQYDAFSRFRTGAYPLLVADYTLANQLEAAAPELRGLWGMTMVPGTVQSDGSVSHATCSNGSGAVIFQKAAETGRLREAWAYVQWFASDEVQAQFAAQMEGLTGTLGRYTPAGPAVLERMSFSPEQTQQLLAQQAQLREIPVLPASYATARGLLYAFREVVNQGENPRDTLLWYDLDMCEEIARKRAELGLDEEQEAQP